MNFASRNKDWLFMVFKIHDIITGFGEEDTVEERKRTGWLEI
jgi:hypothetical protein